MQPSSLAYSARACKVLTDFSLVDPKYLGNTKFLAASFVASRPSLGKVPSLNFPVRMPLARGPHVVEPYLNFS